MGKVTNEDFVRHQKKVQEPVLREDLTGKVVVVTGANVGLGFETAVRFATMNPERLILTSRNEKKGAEALKALKERTGFERAEVWRLDQSSFSSVRAFANRVLKETNRLDFLVENAGAVADATYSATEDGWQTSFQVNILGPELLAILLLPRLLETAKVSTTKPRLVVVSSDTHYTAVFDEDVIASPNIHKHLSDEKNWKDGTSDPRYRLEKLFNVFFFRSLTDHIGKSSPIVVNATSPGFCHSELRRNSNGAYAKLEDEYALTTEEGGRHIVFNALYGLGDAQKEAEIHGAYTSTSEFQEVDDFVLSDVGKNVQSRVWDEMVEILSKVDERVPRTVGQYLK